MKEFDWEKEVQKHVVTKSKTCRTKALTLLTVNTRLHFLCNNCVPCTFNRGKIMMFIMGRNTGAGGHIEAAEHLTLHIGAAERIVAAEHFEAVKYVALLHKRAVEQSEVRCSRTSRLRKI